MTGITGPATWLGVGSLILGEGQAAAAQMRPAGGINLLLAPAMAVTAMFSVQLGSGLSKPMMAELGASGTTVLRLAWAALLLVLIVRPRFRSYDRRQWLAALLLGLAMTATAIFYFLSLERIPLGLASAIEFLGPLGIAAAHMRRWHHLIWPVLAAIGIALLVHDSHGWTVDLLGAGFALLAAGGWASYILASKRVGKLFTGHDGLAMSFLFATLTSLPFGYGELVGHLSFNAILQMAGLAILVPLLPFALEMSALRRLSTRSFGVLMSAEPAIGALIGLVVLGEFLSWLQWIGIACVTAASIGAVLEGGAETH
jgi:inner membrane transporter RhtA